jgi:hypothetical protein
MTDHFKRLAETQTSLAQALKFVERKLPIVLASGL